MPRKHLCSALVALALLAVPSVSSGQAVDSKKTVTLRYLALGAFDLYQAYGFPRTYVDGRGQGEWGGWGDLQFVTVGFGFMSGRNGLLLAVRVSEVSPSGESGDYMLAAASLPLYVYGVRALGAPGAKTPAFLTVFVGGSENVAYDMPYLNAGVGVKTGGSAFIHLQAQLVWRRQLYDGGQGRRDFFLLGGGLEIGGIRPGR